MQLSTVQFERIVRAAGGDGSANRTAVVPAGARVAAERRAVARVSLGRRVQMQVSEAGADQRWQTALVRDVCETGLSVLTDAKLLPGDLFVVRLQTGPSQHLCVESRVCWAEAGGYGHVGYLVGAAFVRVIEHQAFVVQATGGRDVGSDAMVELKPARRARQRKGMFGVTGAFVAVFDAARSICGRRTQDDFR